MDLIQQVGAFAGLAAFIGLTVLALLYFSQARDVRRLREWAGRAPERAAVSQEREAEARPRPAEPGLLAEAPLPPPPPGRAARRLAEQSTAAFSVQGRSWRDRLPEPRYLALIIGGVIILGAGLAVGATQLLGGGSDGGSSSAHGKRTPGPVVPGNVEVAVLNGTSVPGLAAKVGDDVKASGFKLGAITNSQAGFGTTIVMFDRGHEAEAKAVAKDLSVNSVKLMSSSIKGVAHGAKVAVIVGDDRANP